MSITMITAEQLAKRAKEFISRQDEPGDYECIIEFQEFVFPELKINRVRQEAMSKLTPEEIAALGLDRQKLTPKIPMNDVDEINDNDVARLRTWVRRWRALGGHKTNEICGVESLMAFVESLNDDCNNPDI